MSFKRIKGSLASGHAKTSWAGQQMYKLGGNAYDAVCASAFAACVAEPLLTSLGGGGIMMARDHKEAPVYGLDFFVNFPGLDGLKKLDFDTLEVKFSGETQLFQTGKNTTAVPGTLKGLLWIIENKCKLSLKQIVQPAVEIAENGVEVSNVQSYTMDLLEPLLSVDESGKEIFYHENGRVRTHDLIYAKKYAKFLKRFSEKDELSFYQDELKRQLLDEFSTGQISEKDIDAYEVKVFQPIEFKYHNTIIHVPAEPCLGGVAVRDLLSELEHNRIEDVSWKDPEHLTRIAHALKNYELNRIQKPFQKGTTHISACDEDGAVVSMSLTNGEGCGYYLSDTGIMMNNMLGEDDLCNPNMSDWKPGERMPSMMCPMIIETKHPIAIGAGGSKRIRSSLVQIINLHLDHGVSLKEAIEYPRINFDGKSFQIEPGHNFYVDEGVVNHELINIWDTKEFYFGGVNAVKGINTACGDSRRGGSGITAD